MSLSVKLIPLDSKALRWVWWWYGLLLGTWCRVPPSAVLKSFTIIIQGTSSCILSKAAFQVSTIIVAPMTPSRLLWAQLVESWPKCFRCNDFVVQHLFRPGAFIGAAFQSLSLYSRWQQVGFGVLADLVIGAPVWNHRRSGTLLIIRWFYLLRRTPRPWYGILQKRLRFWDCAICLTSRRGRDWSIRRRRVGVVVIGMLWFKLLSSYEY